MNEIQYLLELYGTLAESYKVLNHTSGVMSIDIAVLKTQMSEILLWGRVIGSGIALIIIERVATIAMGYKKNNKNKK